MNEIVKYQIKKEIEKNTYLNDDWKARLLEIMTDDDFINHYDEWYLLKYTLHGDYCGDSVTRANYETIKKEQEEKKLYFETWSGWYNSKAYQIHIELIEEKEINYLSDIYDQLKTYPILDEEELSRIEEEIINKEIEDFKKSNRFLFYNDSFDSAAFDFLRGCSKDAFSVDYSEDDFKSRMEQEKAILLPTDKIIEIIEEFEDKIKIETIIEKLQETSGKKVFTFENLTAEQIGKLLSEMNLHENEIQRIKENF
jgi:hypothetical protein